MARKNKNTQKLTGVTLIADGYIVVDLSSAMGGVHYQREHVSETLINHDHGLLSKIATIKTVDHVEAVVALDRLVKEADYACKKHCAKAIFGWFATPEALVTLREEFTMLREKADRLNALAQHAGSERIAFIDFVPSKIDVANPSTARAIAKTITEVLGKIHAALRAGDIRGSGNRLHAPLVQAKNLEQLAVGIAGEAVKNALELIPLAKKEIADRIDNGETPESAGHGVDLGAIETALDWFDLGGLSGMGDVRGLRAVESALGDM